MIDPTRQALEEFVRGLAPDRFYVSAEAALVAFERREELARRQPAEIAGVPVFVATAEDTIVAKLDWARAGESERQLRDVVGILALSGERLDRDYLERWIAELGLQALWERANAEVV